MEKFPEYLLLIGASAGGFNVIKELVSQLDETMPLTVLMVLHIGEEGVGESLVERLKRFTSYRCKLAEAGEKIAEHTIYLAPADNHLLVGDDQLIIGRGPRENRWRPSIDVLFRSAAARHGSRVIGVILSGMLDDGVAGMNAVKRAGGTSIVQDPAEATFPEMPRAVINDVDVDYIIKSADFKNIISTIISRAPVAKPVIPPDLIAEADIEERMNTNFDRLDEIGTPTVYTCPDCGGALWNIKNGKVERYRCHIGHAFTQKELLRRQQNTEEASLWIALRIMEERKSLLMKMAGNNATAGASKLSSKYQSRADELDDHIQTLRNMLFSER